MQFSSDSKLERVYQLLSPLEICNHRTERRDLPESGIYLFFEKGEQIALGEISYNRIVRVGTHNQDGNFPQRIRQHYGNKSSLQGNKNGSVFRLHLGGAIMRRSNPDDPRLSGWLKHMGPSDPSMEEQVSRQLRENFTFVWFAVPRKEDRLSLEEGLIALLAADSRNRPSEHWLGKYSANQDIVRTGLWNTSKTSGCVLTNDQLNQLEELILHD